MGRIFSVITACGALAVFWAALIVAGSLSDDPSEYQVLASGDRLHQQRIGDLAQQLEQRTARLRELDERLLALEQLLGTAQGEAGGASTLPLPVQEYLNRHIQSRWQKIIRTGRRDNRPIRPVASRVSSKASVKSRRKVTARQPARSVVTGTTATTAKKKTRRLRTLGPTDVRRRYFAHKLQQKVHVAPERAGKVADSLIAEQDAVKKIRRESRERGGASAEQKAKLKQETEQQVKAILTAEEFDRFITWHGALLATWWGE